MNLFYRETAPSEKTKHFVLSFWEFAAESGNQESVKHEVFPDGCLNVVFRRSRQARTKQISVLGINLKSVVFDVCAGDVFWGMRISPAAARKFLGFNPLEFSSQTLEFLPNASRNLIETFNRFNDCKTFAEAIEIFEGFVETSRIKSPEIDWRLENALQIFLETSGQIKISEIADRIGMSRRQFERNFRFASGLTPKQFARICRVRATAINLVEESGFNWARRAAETGFADQSHLTHELISVTGRSPASFAKIIKRVEHGAIIK